MKIFKTTLYIYQDKNYKIAYISFPAIENEKTYKIIIDEEDEYRFFKKSRLNIVESKLYNDISQPILAWSIYHTDDDKDKYELILKEHCDKYLNDLRFNLNNYHNSLKNNF